MCLSRGYDWKEFEILLVIYFFPRAISLFSIFPLGSSMYAIYVVALRSRKLARGYRVGIIGRWISSVFLIGTFLKSSGSFRFAIRSNAARCYGRPRSTARFLPVETRLGSRDLSLSLSLSLNRNKTGNVGNAQHGEFWRDECRIAGEVPGKDFLNFGGGWNAEVTLPYEMTGLRGIIMDKRWKKRGDESFS